MLFYLLLFIVSAFLVNFGNRCKRNQGFLLVAAGILLPVLVATFRGSLVGKDTLEYTAHLHDFMSVEGFRAVLMVISTEPFFLFTCYLAKFSGWGMPVIFFCYSFLTILFAYKAIANYKRFAPIWLGFILFLFFFFNASLNIMRQILAVAFMLYASTILFEGKRKRFFILTIISFLFHVTAVVAGVIIYIIYRTSKVPKRRRKIAYLKFYLLIIVGFLMVDVVMSLLARLGFGNSHAYTASVGESQISVTDVSYSLLFILISYLAMSRKWISRLNPNFFYLSSVASLALFLTGYYNPWLMRMGFYLLAFIFIYLPLIAMSEKLKQYRGLLKIAFLGLGFMYWLYLIVISGSHETIPYYTSGGIMFNF